MASDSDTLHYGSSLILWIWRIMIVTIVVIYIFVFTAGYLSRTVDITDLELNSFRNRILFSPNCLAYEDKIVHPGIIDLTKFDSYRLNDCFQKNNFNFQLKLFDLNNNELSSAHSSPQSIELAPLCNAISTIKCAKSKEYVLIKDSTGERPAIMEVIIIKNV